MTVITTDDDLLAQLFAVFSAGGGDPGHFDGLDANARWESDFFQQEPQNAAEISDAINTLRTAFPDLRFERDGETMTGDGTIAVEFVLSGTNDGHLPGVGITKRAIKLRGSAVAETDGKRITRLKTHWNWAHGMAQLGIRAHARPGV